MADHDYEPKDVDQLCRLWYGDANWKKASAAFRGEAFLRAVRVLESGVKLPPSRRWIVREATTVRREGVKSPVITVGVGPLGECRRLALRVAQFLNDEEGDL